MPPISPEDLLTGCLAGRIAAHAAIAQLLLAGVSAADIRESVRARRNGSVAWSELDRLTKAAPLERLQRMLDVAGVRHDEAATIRAIAAMFDQAVAESPEASVALYSLGDPGRLQQATAEIIDWLCRTHLIRQEMNVLDLGCGIGRVSTAVAPHVRWVLGTDFSRAMLQQAIARSQDTSNISFVMNTGEDLAMLADATFDLVLAVDSFPYLVQAGVADRHIAGACRVLRPQGRLVLLNVSYRNNTAADDADAERWSRSYRFALQQRAMSPFQSWDGVAYVFSRI